MVNDLRELMHEATDRPPRDHDDLSVVLSAGRRRVRGPPRGRRRGYGAAPPARSPSRSVAVAEPGAAPTWRPPGCRAPDGPVVRLADARPAVEGQDYRELASYTNENLDADNGQYFDGVTDDGLVLFRDGPRRTGAPALRADGPGDRREGLAARPVGHRPEPDVAARAQRGPAGPDALRTTEDGDGMARGPVRATSSTGPRASGAR